MNPMLVNLIIWIGLHISLPSFIEELDTTCVYIVGDLNADILDDNSLFARHLHNFCSDNDLILSSESILPRDSFTYISEAHHTVSWLDHCLSTADAHESIQSIEVFYNFATGDHIPVCITLDVNNLPILSNQTNNCTKHYLDWSGLQKADIDNYYNCTEQLLQSVPVPIEATLCRNANCNLESHINDICKLYDNVVDALTLAGASLKKVAKNIHKGKPGWNEHVAELHTAAREALLLWKDTGKTKQGPIFELKKMLDLNTLCAI